MKYVVAQVHPVLCLNKQAFIDAIDTKVSSIIEETGPVDLIIFPEALGLWMCLMTPSTKLSQIFSRFLHKHQENVIKLTSIANQTDNQDYTDSAVVNLQFARPKDMSQYVSAASNANVLTSLSLLPEYQISAAEEPLKRSKWANKIAKIAEWVFMKVPLRFLAQYFRSEEMFQTYCDAFGTASKKYNLYIQGGSIIKREVGGVKNIAYTFDPEGNICCTQEKRHPIPFESMIGIKEGQGLQTWEIGDIKCGIAICADLNFEHDLVEELTLENCRFIASPSGGLVPSHIWKFDYEQDVKNAQEARAKECGVEIGRSYNAGDLLEGMLKFQGLSTIVNKSGLVSIVPEDKIFEEYNLVGELK